MSAVLFAQAAGVAEGIVGESGLGLPRDVSMHGHRIDTLLQTTNVLVAFLFVVMCVWMGWACLRHNRRHAAVYAPGGTRRGVLLTLSLSAFVFAVVDGNLTVNTLIDLKDVFWNFERAEQDPRVVRVEINAHQWAWDARYAGADGQFATADDIVTWNELVVPAGAPVYVQLTSTDVVHGFWIPNMRLKQDAVPGMVNHLWFQPKDDAEGSYAIACTQHCGAQHYKMAGVLRVVSQERYAAWHAEASELARRGYDPDDTAAHWGWPWKSSARQGENAR